MQSDSHGDRLGREDTPVASKAIVITTGTTLAGLASLVRACPRRVTAFVCSLEASA